MINLVMPLLLLSVDITWSSLALLSQASPLSCIQILSSSSDYKTVFKSSTKFINIARNEADLMKIFKKTPTCLLYIVNPSIKTQTWLASLQRHLIFIEGFRCEDLVTSQFNTDMYCISDDDSVFEKYSIRGTIVFRKVSTLKTENPLSIYNKKLDRRSDLQGAELTVTTLNYGRGIENAVYGPYGSASVTGYFGDLFMILCIGVRYGNENVPFV